MQLNARKEKRRKNNLKEISEKKRVKLNVREKYKEFNLTVRDYR